MHAQATRDRVRGKHRAAYREGTNVILLDAGIAKAFPDSASVALGWPVSHVAARRSCYRQNISFWIHWMRVRSL